MSPQQPVHDAPLGEWLWSVLDERMKSDDEVEGFDELHEELLDEPGREPLKLAARDQAVVQEVGALIDDVCALWRRRSGGTLPRAEVAETRQRVGETARYHAELIDLFEFLEGLCALVEDQYSAAPEATESDSWLAGWWSWTHEVPLSRPAPDLKRLEAGSDDCWALYTAACQRGLGSWKRELADTVLRLSCAAFVAASHVGQWEAVVLYRGRYQAAYGAVQHARSSVESDRPATFMLHNPHPTAYGIGYQLARAHGRQQGLLGDAIAISGPSISFDFAIHCRWTTGREVDAFLMGYAESTEGRLATVLERLAPDDFEAQRRPTDDREVAVPVAYEQSYGPGATYRDFTLCTWSLQQNKEIGRALEQRLEALSSPGAQPDPADALAQAVLACEAADVAPHVNASSRALFMGTVASLFVDRRHQEVVDAVDAARPYLDALLEEPEASFVEGVHLLSLSRIAPPDEEGWLVVIGCHALTATHDPIHLDYCARVVKSALANPAFGEYHAELVGLLVRCQTRLARLGQRREPIADLAGLLDAATQQEPSDATALLDAAKAGVAVLLGSGTGRERPDYVAAAARADEHPELDDLRDLLVTVAPRPTPEADAGRAWLGGGIGAATHRALLAQDWRGAAQGARDDLESLGQGDEPDQRRTLLVGILARALRGIADDAVDRHVVVSAAEEVRRILDTFGGALLGGTSAPMGQDAERLWVLSAGNLGLAAVALHRRVRDRDFPLGALRLLERAAEIAVDHADPLEMSGCLHDLAHAYFAYTLEVSGREEYEYVDRAIALFREVLMLHQALRREPGGAIGLRDRPEHVDYLNLGYAYAKAAALLTGNPELGDATSEDGALYLRAALWTLSLARDIGLESGAVQDAADTNLQLADLKVELAQACLDHTHVHKGAFRTGFQHFLSVIEQVPSSTWDFASRYALSALRDVDDALAQFAAAPDVRGLTSALSAAFGILGMAQLRHGVTGVPRVLDDNQWNMSGMRQTALVVLYERFQRLLADPTVIELPEVQSELTDWSGYLRALMRLESFASGRSSVEDLLIATAEFERLRRSGDPIMRAFARPYAAWFAVSRDRDLVAVNGLAIASTRSGIEVTLPSQGRSFAIDGLPLSAPDVLIRDSSWVKTNSTGAVTSRLPHYDWSGAPPVLPVLAGVCRHQGSLAKLLIARLPASSWDVWVMHLAVADGSKLDLALPFRLRGVFQVAEEARKVREAGPLGDGQVAIMDAAGLTLEVSAESYGDSEKPVARVRADGTMTRLSVTGEVRIAIRTSPVVVDGDVTLIVRADSPYSGACGAATSPVVSPTLAIPSSLMRAYSPLMLFDDEVDRRLLHRLRESTHRQMLVVGAPTTSEATEELLRAIFDPRRDVVCFVTPEEAARVTAAVDRLTESLSRLCAFSIFSVAGSTDSPNEGAPRIQIVEVPRSLAPAAAQLALDLIAYRRYPVEDIPTGVGERPFTFEILGDLAAMRRRQTELPNPARWDDLVERCSHLSDELQVERIGPSELFRDAPLFQSIARRSVLVVPEDEALLLVCTPYARHLGALLLPDEPLTWERIKALEPPRVLRVNGHRGAEPGRPVELLPSDPHKIAIRFAVAAREEHEAGLRALRAAGTAGASDELLLRRMEPSAYAVIASRSTPEREAAALAANYAAALGSPLLLFDDERIFSSARLQAGNILSGGAIRGDRPRDAMPDRPFRVPDLARLNPVALTELEDALEAIKPVYVGFVSHRMTVPVELSGETPLATRYAVGRLTAPDATALSLLITAAALHEETVRDPRVSAVVVEAAGALRQRDLPEARVEALHIRGMLAKQANIAVTDISSPDDRDRFVSIAGDAAIIHFCGHGRYAEDAPADTGLIFRQGVLRPDDIPAFQRAAPIVFANACESGVAASAEGLGRAWSGLAAAFIEAGALNYLGSLWPILDEGSRNLAESFYALLVQGHSVGESLRQAKRQAYLQGDLTWAAVVLFGCPRNRLRSGSIDLA